MTSIMDMDWIQSLLNDEDLTKHGIFMDEYPLMHPKYVIGGLAFYVLSILVFQPSKSAVKKTKKSKSKKNRKFGTIEKIIFAHNALLAIFSGVCFYSIAPVVINLFATKGFQGGCCAFNTLYLAEVSSFGYWSWLFYLSKYYEFIDTWIVIARGRRPIFLQEYHHCGAVICMWLITMGHSLGGLLLMFQNSFIHTIMYSYYSCSVAGIKFPLSKPWITRLQIVQFVNGVGGCAIALWVNWGCATIGERIAATTTFCYGVGLIILFSNFYRQTYNKNNKKQE